MSQDELQHFVEQFTDFAGNISARVEKLEAHAERANEFLFVDTPDRSSFATVITKVDRHIGVLCDYAKFAKWGVIAVATIGGAAGGVFGIIKLIELFK